jgi:VCBS repeat-containing protein
VIKLPCSRIAITTLILLTLISCGGGGGSNTSAPDTSAPDTSAPDTTTPVTTPDNQSKSISGGGVKGPLANAVVTVYAFDTAQTGFKGVVVTTASTGADAAITGLALPFPLNLPYIMEFTSNAGTTDITTGMSPVITTMRTVITQALLDNGEQIYATPLTTMAVDIAVSNAIDSNGTNGIQVDEFETALPLAAAQVVSTLGFGLGSSVDIFDTPPLVDSTTDSTEEQAAVAAYRTAVEAVTAIAWQIDQQTSGGDSDSVLAELAADLADGAIDGSAGSEINLNTLQVLEQDPASMPIPNTGQTVAQVQAILIAETATTGSSTSTTQLGSGGSIKTTAKPAEPNPDLDNDGVLNINDQFPTDATADTDSDRDGAPDVAYNDASRTTIDTNRSDPDDDNDGWNDDLDDYSLDNTRFLNPLFDRDNDTVNNGNDNCALTANTNQTDTNGNGQGDACSDDNDGDGVDDSVDNCPIIANPGQEDLDGDAITGGGDACDADIDGDNTANGTDAFPRDGNETTDTDGDGLGDAIADSDDDNDGVTDTSDSGVAPSGAPSEGIACSLLRDCDGDGTLDRSDLDRTDPAVSVNYAPVANNDAATADEDAATFAIAVTLNDTDDDGNPNDEVNLSGIGEHNTTLGTAVINGNNIDYTPALNASGSDSFSYTVTDDRVSATATVTVTITAVNDAPVARDDTADAIEDITVTTVNVLSNDTDEDGGSLAVAAGNPSATNGTVVNNNDGTFAYTPNANFNGPDNFDYTVNDGNGGSANATVTITVAAINDAPSATAGNLIVDEDSTANPGTVGGADIDGDGLNYALNTQAENGTAEVSADGSYTYTPNLDFNSGDSFSFVANDGTVNSAPASITIAVTAVNDAPSATAGNLNVVEDSMANAGTVGGTDIDGDSLTYTLNSQAENGTVVVNSDGSYTYTPDVNFNSGDSFSFVANDGTVNSVPASITITVTAVNDAPSATAGNLTVVEDSTANPGTVDGIDTDGDSLTYSLNAQASNGTAVVNSDGSYTYTPNPDFNSSDSFSFVANDGAVNSAPAVVSITVDAINDAPVAVDDSAGMQPDTTLVVNVLANDTDIENDVLSITNGSITTPSAGSISGSDLTAGTITFDATGVDDGTNVTFTYTAFDGLLSSAAATVTIQVTANPTPVASAGTLTVVEDTTDNAGTLSAIDDDPVTFTLASQASNGTAVVNANGSYTFTPNANFSGPDNFTFTADDGVSVSTPATIIVTVMAINDAPTATAPILTVAEDSGSPGTSQIEVSDEDIGDTHSYVIKTNGSNGIASVDANGLVNYTPTTANFNGADSVVVTVSDSATPAGTIDIIITVDVTAVNDLPTISGTPNDTITNGSAYSFMPTAADVDEQALTFSIENMPAWTNFTIADGTLAGTPELSDVGGDFSNIIISVTSGSDTVALPAFTITVNAAPTGGAVWDSFNWDDGSTWQ